MKMETIIGEWIKTDDLQYLRKTGQENGHGVYEVIEARCAEDDYVLCSGTISVCDYFDDDNNYNSYCTNVINSYYESVENFESIYKDKETREQILAEMLFEETFYFELSYRIVSGDDVEKELEKEINLKK